MKEEIEMRSISAIRQDQYLHLDINQGQGNMGFRELEHMEELPCDEDILMDIGGLNHRLIESIEASEIKVKVSSASTKKRKRDIILSQDQSSGPINEESMQERRTFI